MAPGYANITRASIKNLTPYSSSQTSKASFSAQLPSSAVCMATPATIARRNAISKPTASSTMATKSASAATDNLPLLSSSPPPQPSRRAKPSSSTTVSATATSTTKVIRADVKKPKAPTSGPPTFHPFLRLPLELREQIYLSAILPHNPSAFSTRIYADSTRTQQRRIENLKTCLLPVCFTSRSEGRIAAATFVLYTTFYMYRDEDVDIMKEWLAKWRFKTIMCVEIFPSANYRKGGLARDVEFMWSCKGLQTIKITLPLRTLQLRFHLKNPYGVSGAAILKALKLADIIKCKSLKKLEITISDHLVKVPKGVKELAEWIRAGCEKAGRKVHVDVEVQEVSLERMREIRSWDLMGF